MKITENYSILMSVYYKEKPEFLFKAIESMLNQTVKSNDFVIVCDGPLTKELYDVLDYFEMDTNNNIHRVQLKKNCGLGNALNVGLSYCKNEIIARMDSDDIAVSGRIEEELNYINNGYELVGSFVDEFEINIEESKNVRYVPETLSEIIKFSRNRNPFNHPSVMFLKSKVIESGGYIDLYRLEDYYLWLRMIKKGIKMYNIPKILLHMRVNQNFYCRRNTFALLKAIYKLRKYQYEEKYISLLQLILLMIIQFILTIIPTFIAKYIYMNFLRKKQINTC